MKTTLTILLLILILSGCSIQRELPQTKQFTVTEVQEKTFIATSGNLKAMFFKVDCDTNIYVGKIITVSRANRIK